MDCYSCDQTAINACKRCAKAYCGDHGNAAYCSECLQPASALPSFNLYRGALMAMLVGTAVAVVLILRPPGETKGAAPVVVGRSAPTPTAAGSPSPTVAARTPETTPPASAIETPGGTPSSTSGTPSASGTASPVPSGTSSPFNEYVVQSGDNLFSIAQEFLPPGDNLTAFSAAIANLNGLDTNDPVLHIGQKLLLPKGR